ncbi:DinB family protein [Paenibacillus macerans]|uniref:DinB family protein n=1 Tax=Paenibacillus macerans TaxID=44252 RepID=UPI003D31AC09
MGPNEQGNLFLKITLHRMCDMYLPKLKMVLGGISQEVLWTEPYPKGNTVGGIALHVCEHIARSCLRLQQLTHQLKPDFESYFPVGGQTAEQLIGLFEQQFQAWEGEMRKLMRGEQRIDAEQIHQLYHLVEHTGYHLGQIIDRIQAATGRKFSFCQNGLNESYLRRLMEQGE